MLGCQCVCARAVCVCTCSACVCFGSHQANPGCHECWHSTLCLYKADHLTVFFLQYVSVSFMTLAFLNAQQCVCVCVCFLSSAAVRWLEYSQTVETKLCSSGDIWARPLFLSPSPAESGDGKCTSFRYGLPVSSCLHQELYFTYFKTCSK